MNQTKKNFKSYIFPGSASSSTTCRWSPLFTVGSFRMLLFDMGIEGWVRKIGLRAIIAFKISTLDVILRPPLAFTGSSVSTVVVIIFTCNLLSAHILAITVLTTSHYLLFLVTHLLVALRLIVLGWHVLP